MSTLELSNSLSSLSDSVRVTFQLINRLSKLSFAPGSTPLEGDGDVRVELTQDIHEGLKQHQDTLELLRQEADDLPAVSARHSKRDSEREKDRVRITAQLARLGEEVKQYVSDLVSSA